MKSFQVVDANEPMVLLVEFPAVWVFYPTFL